MILSFINMILSFINIRKVPREMLKTSGFALGFQHLPQDLANVNEWKIMFDPYYCINSKKTHQKLRKYLHTLFFSLTTIFLRAHAFYEYPRFGPWPGTFSHGFGCNMTNLWTLTGLTFGP